MPEPRTTFELEMAGRAFRVRAWQTDDEDWRTTITETTGASGGARQTDDWPDDEIHYGSCGHALARSAGAIIEQILDDLDGDPT